VPIRFVPFEKISKHYKLMLAFDALVLWKASGQMPTKGIIIHGLQHTILGLRLDTLIHEVQLLVGKLRALLSESGGSAKVKWPQSASSALRRIGRSFSLSLVMMGCRGTTIMRNMR
jgi:hypothetical protein